MGVSALQIEYYTCSKDLKAVHNLKSTKKKNSSSQFTLFWQKQETTWNKNDTIKPSKRIKQTNQNYKTKSSIKLWDIKEIRNMGRKKKKTPVQNSVSFTCICIMIQSNSFGSCCFLPQHTKKLYWTQIPRR